MLARAGLCLLWIGEHSKRMTADTMIEAELAGLKALLNTLISYPRRWHFDAEALYDTAWEYLRAANHAHAAVAEVLRETASELTA